MALKRHLVGGVVVLAAAVGLVGCSRDKGPEAPADFCRAAARYEKELERQASKAREDIPRQIELVERLYETAPAAIRDDAKVFLDAMRRVESDPSLRDNPRIRRAVENVNRVAAQGCDTYKSNRTPGI